MNTKINSESVEKINEFLFWFKKEQRIFIFNIIHRSSDSLLIQLTHQNPTKESMVIPFGLIGYELPSYDYNARWNVKLIWNYWEVLKEFKNVELDNESFYEDDDEDNITIPFEWMMDVVENYNEEVWLIERIIRDDSSISDRSYFDLSSYIHMLIERDNIAVRKIIFELL